MKTKIVKFFYKVFLAFNSIMLFVIVYLINRKYRLPILCTLPDFLYFSIYLLVPLILSLICLWSAKLLSKEEINGDVKDVEEANNSYLPSYLGYFFVALSIDDTITLLYIYIILFVFIFHSQALYFNPMFLLFGYRFYYLTLKSGMKIVIITRKEITENKGLKFDSLRRINRFTFIDKGSYK